MALPQYAQDVLSLLQQGPVEVRIASADIGGGDLNLILKEGVSVTIGRDQEEVNIDVIGRYDYVTSGDRIEVGIPLDEQSRNVLGVVFADIGIQGTDYVSGGKTAGVSLRSIAKQMEIRPWQGRANETPKLTIWLAVPTGDGVLTMGKTEPYGAVQTFEGLPDVTKPDGQMRWQLACGTRGA